MPNSGKKINYLRHANLGRLVAEHDNDLADYYVDEDRYVSKAYDTNDPATFFIGPKGVGKSAILQMVRINNARDFHRIVDITPDTLAFSALANIEATTPLLKEYGKNQWLFKSLWDYVISLEILHREYRDAGAIESIIKKIFAGRHEKEARRLLKISISDSGSPLSLSSRILMLINEIEVSAEYSEVKVAAKAGIDGKESEQGSHLTTLGLINSVAKHVHESLHNTYYILIDDLDTNWTDTPIQNDFVASLFLSLKNFSKPPRLKCVVSMKEQIFRSLPLQDRDKLRDWICQVEWDFAATKQILTQRIRKKLTVDASLVWNTVFPADGFDRMWKHSYGRPRELIRLAGLAMAEAKRGGHLKVEENDLDSAISTFSDERIDDLESEYSHSYSALGLVLRKFRGWQKEFPYRKFASDFAEILALEVELHEGQSNRYSWAGGYGNDPKGLAVILLQIGFLQVKASRMSAPKNLDMRHPQEVSDASWFSIHPMYWAGLALVNAS